MDQSQARLSRFGRRIIIGAILMVPILGYGQDSWVKRRLEMDAALTRAVAAQDIQSLSSLMTYYRTQTSSVSFVAGELAKGGEPVQDFAITMIESQSEIERAIAMWTLGFMPRRWQFPIKAARLSESRLRVLGGALLKLVDDPKERITSQLPVALAEFGPLIFEDVIALADSKKESVTLIAAKTLGKIPTKKSCSLLKKLMADPSTDVQSAAAYAHRIQCR